MARREEEAQPVSPISLVNGGAGPTSGAEAQGPSSKQPVQPATAPLSVITEGTLAAIAQDVLTMLRTESNSANTADARERDLADFLAFYSGQEATAAAVAEVIALLGPALIRELADYKRDMRERKLAPATINRRLATVRALLRHAHRLGAPCPDPAGLVKAEKPRKVRETAGPPLEEAVAVLSAVDRATVKGKRDYAMLLLLMTNALRRDEVLSTDVGDLNARRGRLRIRGKGDDGHKIAITLDSDTVRAIIEYLQARSEALGKSADGWKTDLSAPLFTTCDHRSAHRQRLTGRGLATVVQRYGMEVIGERLRPHGFRHMAATAALALTHDIPKVQRLTRHRKIDTLMAYRDELADDQGEVTKMLAERIRELRAKQEM